MEANRVMARAKTHLMLKQPFFGSLAMALPTIEDTDISTMATDGKSIRFNPSFVDRIPFEQTMGVVAHEVMHVALKHMLRRGTFDPKIWNMATDYAINLIVVDSGLQLPEEGLLDREFEGLSAESIYNKLLEKDENGELPQPQEGWNFGEVEEMKGEDGSALSEQESDAVEQDIDVKVLQAVETAKMMGGVPAGIDEMVKQMKKPKVDWREKLRLFIEGDQPDDYTWRRPNRKFYSGYGIYMPSVDHYGTGDLVVAVDSSASVSADELAQYLGEINAISEDMSPRSITVIACDTQIQSVQCYEQGETVEMLDAKGRGGTRVSPVFNYIEEQGLDVDSMVYFTDLYVSDFPDAPDYPVLWVSTGADEAPFGEVVSARH